MDKVFVDIHNHFAWEIDDGMKSLEHAKKALEDASNDGIRKIVATPHYIPGEHTESDVNEIHERVAELIALAKSYDIQVFEGAELFLNSSYLETLENKMCPTLAQSRYLLCEFDVRKELSNEMYDVEEKLYEIKVRGFIPVIAHVERYFHKKLDIKRVMEWIQSGYKIQINRTSLLGMHGEVCKNNAHCLIEHNLAHVVASDAHRSEGTRIAKMSDVYAHITKHFGQDCANILCIVNPNNILENKELESLHFEKKSMFAKLFKRS